MCYDVKVTKIERIRLSVKEDKNHNEVFTNKIIAL